MQPRLASNSWFSLLNIEITGMSYLLCLHSGLVIALLDEGKARVDTLPHKQQSFNCILPQMAREELLTQLFCANHFGVWDFFVLFLFILGGVFWVGLVLVFRLLVVVYFCSFCLLFCLFETNLPVKNQST